MGMFDSFILKAKCPYCGNEDETEFQTKQFRCVLMVWKEGDVFTNCGDIEIQDGLVKNVYGSCLVKDNNKCGLNWEKLNSPNTSGFGRQFECDVRIKDGIIQEAVNIRKN